MKIIGYWYVAGSSERERGEIRFSDGIYEVWVGNKKRFTGEFNQLQISDRVGNIPRKLTLENGSLFDTPDNDLIDQLLKENNTHSARSSLLSGLVHGLETKWRWVLSSIVVAVLSVFLTVYFGLPWASEKLAKNMPVIAQEKISEGTLKILDEVLLEESQLPAEVQDRQRQNFMDLLNRIDQENFSYRLHFRAMSDLPNAFALPSGDIIVTDALIDIAESQDEIDAVLFHEIGLVKHRHGMEQLIRGTFITIAVTMIAGDASAIDQSIIAFPIFLMQSQYSREHETEADDYAFQEMIKAGIDPIAFATIMEKIGNVAVSSEVSSEQVQETKEPQQKDQYTEYFSSHPLTENRIERAKEMSEQFQQHQQ